MLAGAIVLAASLTQNAPAAAPSGPSVRVHFSTPGNKQQAMLWARRGNDSDYTAVCAAPCTVDIPVGTPLRATITNHEDEPHDFVLSTERSEINLEARRGGRGALVGGIIVTSVGGLVAVIGAMLTLISLVPDVREDQSIRTAGFVCIGIGAGGIIGGLALIKGRTYEPTLKEHPVEKKGWAEIPLPSVSQPFSFTVTF